MGMFGHSELSFEEMEAVETVKEKLATKTAPVAEEVVAAVVTEEADGVDSTVADNVEDVKAE